MRKAGVRGDERGDEHLPVSPAEPPRPRFVELTDGSSWKGGREQGDQPGLRGVAWAGHLAFLGSAALDGAKGKHKTEPPGSGRVGSGRAETA